MTNGKQLVYTTENGRDSLHVYVDAANMLVTEIRNRDRVREEANCYELPQFLGAYQGQEPARKVMQAVSTYCSRLF